ncbi:DUF1631 domain-containing protein [Gilvimarinus chinensis]|uniref:DUF1631 domain-containing protein n=1 Tax=Gilvimarinus chinensis TaxID=396005 RepID=UPI00035E3ECB|nr:DUF1631 domain-containing protein [Gilvimarinus chinensis]
MSSSGSKNRENVVPLNPDQKRSAETSLARMPAPMHQLREKSRMQLQVMLRDLFDKTDDALFELADKATNNHEQNLYFDSMRQVRLRRKETEAEFFRRIDIGFAHLLSPESFSERVEEREVSLDNMALVDHDELEEMVASETMVNRASEQFSEKLQHLTLRMDQLVPAKVYLKNNPVGPEIICHGFVEAASAIEIDVKARLVLFKLFDRHVMSQLGEIYELLNQQLIDANILPSMRGAPKVQREQPRQPVQEGGNAEGARSAGNYAEVDESSEQVLLQLRELLQGQPGHHGAEASVGAAGQGPRLSSQDVLSLLNLAQQRTVQRNQPLASADEVKSLLSGLLAQGGEANKSINQVDEDVINLVSMMFEFILEDRSLASPMKVLLARLQIPMIKVAIADKSFFGKGGHPARRLLNEMATAALGWQDSGEEGRAKDALYRRVDETVNRILADYSKDVGIFEALLLEFRAFQEKEKRRAQILEQRTIDAEDGKAKSQRARAEVDAALAEVTAGVKVPQAAAQLLAAAWSNVMFITCLKEGEDSDAFEAQLDTARDLVWSTTTAMDAESRQKLLTLVPGLLARLRKGLEDIAFNPYQMGQMFKALEKLHLDILRGKVDITPEVEATPLEKESLEELERDDSVVGTVEPTLAEQAHAEAMVELVPETEDYLDTQHLALVSNLTQGSWFEMITESGDKCRCRLAAIIKPTGKYIFVNRTGMKVAEQSREGLACALRDGKMLVLDDGMLFDRALESVIGSLRQSRGV